MRFDNWTLQMDTFPVRQYDNLTRRLEVSGDIPEGWSWAALLSIGDNLNIISLQYGDPGLYVDLTDDMIPYAGKYNLQLRATQGDKVRHTNIVQMQVNDSMSGDEVWPELPSEFSQAEQRITELNEHPPKPGDNGFWLIWNVETDQYEPSDIPLPSGGGSGSDGGYYMPEVTQPSDNTMQVSFAASEDDMPPVEPVSVTLPAGPAGRDGEDGAPGLPGQDGFSPAVQTEPIEGGTKVTITDATGPKEFEVMDGTNGQDGQPGRDGEPGAPGTPGRDGYSPIVQTAAIDGGTRVTITDADGPKTFDVLNGTNGEDGEPGQDGAPGRDGFSPTASVTQTEDGAKITITDKSGTTNATITNGKDGINGTDGADGKSAYAYAQAGGFTGTEEDFAEKLATDIPEKLPNPHALTFSGTVTGNYDGSAPVEIYIDNGLNNSVPDYVTTEAETVARIVNRHQSNDSVIFPFLSDAHCGYYTDPKNGAAKLAGQLLNLIGKRAPFDFIVNGGDYSTGAWNTTRDSTYQDIENYTELTAEAHKGIAAIWVPGNHDDAPYMATEDRATQKDVFTLIGRKNRLSGAVCPNGCNYGYMDLDNRKLRVIYLDTDDKRRWGTVAVGAAETPPDYLNAHNVGGEQLLWLANTALDFTDKTNPTEWSIIVVSHVALNISGTIIDAVSGTAYAHSTENAATILNAYKNGKRGSITHNDVTVEYDFSTLASRAVVICCVHGHNHSFCDEMVGSILSIGCPNVMNGREQESSDGNTYTKTAGTADGTSFCILTIDRENCMIYADCVGVGYDREFTFTSETIAYTNQIPISTDTDGSVYNGVGYQAGYRLGSSGTPSAESSSYITGFIPCKVGDVVRMKNITFQYGVTSGLTSNNQRLSFYDSSKTHLLQTNATGLGGVAAGIKGDDDIWTQFRPQKTMDGVDCSDVAYFRINAAYIGEDSVITVNETID